MPNPLSLVDLPQTQAAGNTTQIDVLSANIIVGIGYLPTQFVKEIFALVCNMFMQLLHFE